MSWVDLHQQSERLAAEAESLTASSPDRARQLYAEAAKLEAEALTDLAPGKLRTLGITSVSAVALWFKARQFGEAQKLAHRVMANDALPAFASQQLQELLQTIWSEEVRQTAGLKFSEGALLVSVSGGQAVTGGAPLDLVLSKVENIKFLFFRTVEYLQHLPHRKHGAAPFEVQNVCRPWLFHAAPGSYQFAVAIEDVAQRTLFGPEIPSIDEINDTFLSFLRASSSDPDIELAERVPDREYRGTILKLTRALAPTGKDFTTLTIKRSSMDADPITLTEESRKEMNQVIKSQFTKPRVSGETPGHLRGILRAVHLDEDWLEIMVQGQPTRVFEVGEAVDDLIGPLVNHEVTAQIVRTGRGRILFRDIEGVS
jgi:hypothetical protein